MSLDAALEAAKRGWAVFPVVFDKGRKVPAVKWRDWATTDVQILHAEWSARNFPAAGIECEKSGLVVVDEDTLGDFQRLADDEGWNVPATYTVRTGRASGGRQFYFTNPGGLHSTDLRKQRYDIDLKGAGGFVVAAGSGHPSGATYRAENDFEPAAFPTWLVDYLNERPGGASTWTDPNMDALLENGIPAGRSQHDTLRDVVWKLRTRYMGKAATRVVWQAIVDKTALTRPEDPWTVRDFDLLWDGADAKAAPEPTTIDTDQAATDLPPLVRLDEFLATPDEPLAYRVDGIWPTGGRVILAAAWKAGKTTLLGNLIRALVDGDLFLGQYRVVQPANRVVLIDDELDKRTLRRWLREQDIVNTDRVELAALRGKVSTFDVVNAETRARWARHIGPADVLLFDCLRPVLDALGLAEGNEAGRFLVAFDALLAEAGIAEAAIAHHMGHVGERSRGDSRLRDWPDVEWRLVRDKSNDDDGDTDPAAPRYFAAYGRDVDQPEQLLGYDVATRRLTITGGSRKEARVEGLVAAVVTYVTDNTGCSQNTIEQGVEGGRDNIRKAISLAVERGRVHREKVGKGWVHTTTSPPRPTSPRRTGEAFDDLATSPIRGEGEATLTGATSPKTKPGEVQAALDLFKDKLGATEIITDEETA